MRNETLKNIKTLLNDGHVIKIKNGTLWLSENRKYIMFRNFGQSAVRNSLIDLRWLLNVIFGIKKNETLLFTIVDDIFA